MDITSVIPKFMWKKNQSLKNGNTYPVGSVGTRIVMTYESSYDTFFEYLANYLVAEHIDAKPPRIFLWEGAEIVLFFILNNVCYFISGITV